MMHRSASADVYTMGHHDPNSHAAMSDDGSGLNELYSKHTLNIPMHPHSPAFSNGSHSPAFIGQDHSQADLDMNNLVSFDDVHASLSPEHHGQ